MQFVEVLIGYDITEKLTNELKEGLLLGDISEYYEDAIWLDMYQDHMGTGLKERLFFGKMIKGIDVEAIFWHG